MSRILICLSGRANVTHSVNHQVLMVAKGDPGRSGIFEVGPDNPNGEKTNTMLLYPGAKAWVYGQMMPGRVRDAFEFFLKKSPERSGEVSG